MAGPLLISVNLATIGIASLLYGMFFVLSASSTYLLVGRYLAARKTRDRSTAPRDSVFRSTVFVAAICLFCAITAHWITTVYRTFLAFVLFRDGQEALDFYLNTRHVTEVVQEGFLMISVLIGDSLIIHRLWVVWEHRVTVAIFPTCTLAALTTCSAVSLFTISHKDTAANYFSDPWLTSVCFLTLVTNVYCTALITLKIWNITRLARPIGGSNLRDFLVIVVESAALYATWAIAFTATYRAHSDVQFLIIQCAPEVVGIANALIHTRVGLGWAVEAQTVRGDPPASQLAFARAPPTPRETDETERTVSGEEFMGRRRGWRDVEEEQPVLAHGNEGEKAHLHCTGCSCGQEVKSEPSATQEGTVPQVEKRLSTSEYGTARNSFVSDKTQREPSDFEDAEETPEDSDATPAPKPLAQ